MNRRLGICLLGLVALTVVWSSLGAGITSAQSGPTAPGDALGTSQPQAAPDEFDATLFRIRLFENRSARWTIQYSRPLNRTQRANFEEFAADFRTTETTTFENFRTRARTLTALGQNTTGREMTAASFARDASVNQFGQYRGVLELSFVWTNFSQGGDGQVEAGDVFEGGMYVGEGQRLEFRTGPNLAFTDVEPPADSMAEQGDLLASESVTWVGEVQFADQRPHATLEPRDAVVGDTDGGETVDATGPAGPNESNTGTLVPMLLAGAAIALAAAGGLAYHRGYLPPGRDETGSGAAGSGGAVSGSDTGGTEVASGTSGTAAAQVSEEELLSDEDRVLQLLEDNDGRMKQVAIVEETDWSKSKVSMLLSDMEEDGQISKLRLGRENIISLAGQEPDAAGSPFDDE